MTMLGFWPLLLRKGPTTEFFGGGSVAGIFHIVLATTRRPIEGKSGGRNRPPPAGMGSGSRAVGFSEFATTDSVARSSRWYWNPVGIYVPVEPSKNKTTTTPAALSPPHRGRYPASAKHNFSELGSQHTLQQPLQEKRKRYGLPEPPWSSTTDTYLSLSFASFVQKN